MPPRKQPAPPPPPRKKPDEPPPEEGLPLWMATFADMVTLLLCFFVLLLSFANQDISKFRSLMGSIKDAFGIQVKRPEAEFAAFSPSKFERKDVELDQENKALLGMVLQLKSLNVDMQKSVKITAEDKGAIMRVPNRMLFDPGSARLKEGAGQVLQNAVTILKEHNFDLVVRGHTDDTAVESSAYPTNWELSSSRAAAVLRWLHEQGEISPTRLKAVGYADTQPLVPNNSDANQVLNRRMELFFHRPETQSW